MRVRAERPPWYLSVVGGALYVSVYAIYWCAYVCEACACIQCQFCFFTVVFQKASVSSAAAVSDYIGYLEKGQIPPKVQTVSFVHALVNYTLSSVGKLYFINSNIH